MQILLCLYLKDNMIRANGVITELNELGVRVCVPKYDFKSAIKFNKIPGLSVVKVSSDSNSKNYIVLNYKSSQDNIDTSFILK